MSPAESEVLSSMRCYSCLLEPQAKLWRYDVGVCLAGVGRAGAEALGIVQMMSVTPSVSDQAS